MPRDPSRHKGTHSPANFSPASTRSKQSLRLLPGRHVVPRFQYFTEFHREAQSYTEIISSSLWDSFFTSAQSFPVYERCGVPLRGIGVSLCNVPDFYAAGGCSLRVGQEGLLAKPKSLATGSIQRQSKPTQVDFSLGWRKQCLGYSPARKEKEEGRGDQYWRRDSPARRDPARSETERAGEPTTNLSG